jgi:hypothetical protein
MANNFVSDFSLFPIKKLGHSGWQYRKATWPEPVESDVHKLYNGLIDGPVLYDRLKERDGTTEHCKICRHGDELHVEPGNGWDYLVRIDSLHNIKDDDIIVTPIINNDDSSEKKEDNVMQQLDCIICFTNKRTHIIKECNHFLLCQSCAIQIFNNDKKCPLCRMDMTNPAKKVFF